MVLTSGLRRSLKSPEIRAKKNATIVGLNVYIYFWNTGRRNGFSYVGLGLGISKYLFSGLGET